LVFIFNILMCYDQTKLTILNQICQETILSILDVHFFKLSL
jgi:hypothetical protein